MTAIEIGNIIHYCLENVIKSHDKESFVNLSREEIVQQVESLSVAYKEENLGGDYGKSQRFEANFKRVKNSIIQTIKHLQEEFSQLEFTPSDFELSIDDNGDYKPLSITNEDGMELFLCGKIDRVDILTTEDKSYVRVIDYKSGNQKFEEEKLPYGIDMQMFLYLFAIIGSDGKYKDFTPAGVLYMPVSEVKIGDSRSDDKKNVASTINNHFKMKGVVLNDINVLKSMEKDLQGVYIPFAQKGRSKKMVLTEGQFDKIRNHAESLLINMANCLSNGDISAKALVFSDEKKDSKDARTVCRYCDYWSICGKYPEIDCNYIDNDEAKNFYKQIISEEDEEDGKLD
jgi:ATP-dependent helicase/nuclease subunit B